MLLVESESKILDIQVYEQMKLKRAIVWFAIKVCEVTWFSVKRK